MKVLITGGAGYIGGAVTELLTRQNVPFTVYDNLLYENHYLKPVDFIRGDVRDTAKLKALLPQYTHVIWLAAIVGDAACQIRPDLTVAVNQEAVKWLAGNYDGRIVFLSTCSVYGQNDGEVTEESALNPLSLYAKTKAEGEQYLVGKNAISFRLGTVFGVSDAYSRLRMDLVVNYMTANALTKGKLSIFGGTQWRPLVHVRNVAEGIVNALEDKATGVYNLATQNYQIKELGKEIAALTGCEIEYVKQLTEDARDYHVSIAKAQKAGLYEFKHLYSVADGVAQIMELIKQGRIQYAENDVYSNERHIANLNKNGKFI